MDDCCLTRFVKAVQVRHGRIERKEGVERQRRGWSVNRRAFSPRKCCQSGSPTEGNGGEAHPVLREERQLETADRGLRPVPRGARGTRQTAPRSEQKFAAVRLIDHGDHLRWNSGDIRRRAKACDRLSGATQSFFGFALRAGRRKYSARWPLDRAYPRRARNLILRYRAVERDRPIQAALLSENPFGCPSRARGFASKFAPAGLASHRVALMPHTRTELITQSDGRRSCVDWHPRLPAP